MIATKTTRKIVKIDEAKCDGCGLCVPNCAEGAIKIIDGKAQLVGENLCDGLGNCLGKCPQDAITIEERPADAFDEQAVEQHLHASPAAPHAHAGGCPGSAFRQLGHGSHGGHASGGCPGAAARMLNRPAPVGAGTLGRGQDGRDTRGQDALATRQSQLAQWPVQLALVPVAGPMWQDADVLVAADCVAFAYPDFNEKLLAGKSLAIACPKLDDVAPYVDKLARIFAGNSVRSVTVAHMEVPCCGGIVYAVHEALERSGRNDIELHDVTIGIDGSVKAQR